MAGQVQVLRTDHRQVVGAFDFEHGVAGPLAVLPAPHLSGEFAEVDFRVEIGGEIFAMGAGIDVENVDRINAVEMLLLRQRCISVDHTRVEAHAKDGRDVLLFALFQVVPFVVAVPRRGLADLARLFVDGGVEVRHAGVDAGTQYRHVEERGTDVDDDLRFSLADQCLGRFHVQSVQREGLDVGGYLEATLGLDAVDDGLAFGDVARRDSNTTEFVVVLRALVGHHLGDTSCTNDKNVLFQLLYLSFICPLYERLDR